MKKSLLLALMCVSSVVFANVYYQGPRRVVSGPRGTVFAGPRRLAVSGPVLGQGMIGGKMRLKFALAKKLNHADMIIKQLNAIKEQKAKKDPKMMELWNKFVKEFATAKATFDELKKGHMEKMKTAGKKIRGFVQDRMNDMSDESATPMEEEVEVEEENIQAA